MKNLRRAVSSRLMEAFIVLFLPISAYSLPTAPSDLDLDGISDLIWLERIEDSDGHFNWLARSSQLQSESTVGGIGEVGDIPALANWLGLDKPQIGIVTLEQNQNLLWKMVDPRDNSALTRTFGTRNHLILSGADFNKNGVADAALARIVGNSVRWEIALDLFTNPDTSNAIKFRFGKKGDRGFFANLYGDGDWVGIIRKNENGRSIVRMRNVLTGEVRVVKGIGKFASSEQRPRPLPVAKADGTDMLAFVVRGGATSTIYVQNPSGGDPIRKDLPGNGEIVVGNFTSESGEELGVDSDNGTIVFNPLVGVTTNIGNPDGVPADEITVDSFASSSEVVPGCESLSPFDGALGFLWKPNSSTRFFAVTVMPEEFTGQTAEVLVLNAANLDIIKELELRGVDTFGRTNWQDETLTGSDYRELYGSIILRVDLKSGHCFSYLIRDPRRRYD